MADLESEDFESAESETELTDKDISDKFPTQIAEQIKIPTTATSTVSSQPPCNSETQQNEQLPNEIVVADSLIPQNQCLAEPKSNLQIKEDTEILEPKDSEKNKDEGIDTPLEDTPNVQQEQTQSGWGWGWGSIGSILTTSVNAVSDSAQSISKGIGSMVMNVEGVLGVPQPDEMVREPDKEPPKDDDNSSTNVDGKNENIQQTEETTGVTGYLSGFTAAVQSTGIDLMTGGLDALEAIGRKTVDIISDGDPGLRNKRAMLAGRDHNTLSQLLREAKETAQEMRNEEGGQTECALNYSILFDQYNGLVHLEALELLSKDCLNKVRTSLATYNGQELDDRNQSVEEIDEYFQEDENEEEIEGCLADIPDILGDLGKKIKVDKIIMASEKARQKILEFAEQSSDSPIDKDEDTNVDGEHTSSCKGNTTSTRLKDYHNIGLHIFAELSSITIELFKKSAEFMLIQDYIDKDGSELGQMFQRVTALVCSEFESITILLTDKLSQETSDEADSLITSLYLESSNSCTYIQDAFNLLQPVLKLKVLESKATTVQPTTTILQPSPTPSQ